MKSKDELKQQAAPERRTYKTKDDFLRWLRKREALKKQAAEEQSKQAERANLLALMVWTNEGGAAGKVND